MCFLEGIIKVESAQSTGDKGNVHYSQELDQGQPGAFAEERSYLHLKMQFSCKDYMLWLYYNKKNKYHFKQKSIDLHFVVRC